MVGLIWVAMGAQVSLPYMCLIRVAMGAQVSLPKCDMLLVMGDFNARVGSDTVPWQGTIGGFGPEEWNWNGVKLLEFCGFNSLVVANTLFSATGVSPMDLVFIQQSQLYYVHVELIIHEKFQC